MVLVALGVLFWFAWPYRGLLPLTQRPPIDAATSDEQSGSQTEQGGTNTTNLPLSLPSGFTIGLFAKDLGNPRVFLRAPLRTWLVSIPDAGKVVALLDEDADGIAEQTKTLIEGVKRPHGLALDPGIAKGGFKLYVAESDALTVYPYDPDTRTVGKRQVVLALPDSGRHWTKTLEWLGTDLLVSIGSSCDVCHEQDGRRGTVQRYSVLTGKLTPFATGLRNAVFMTKRGAEIWATEMGRDFLGDDLPPDEINILRAGHTYGWPVCYGQRIHDTDFDKNTYIRNPCEDTDAATIDLPAHSAPLGIAFVPKGIGWPKEYEGNLLVAYHGSWNRSVPTGYAIRRFVLNENNLVVKEEDFVSGWLTERGVVGRPVDLTFEDDGSLYVTDDRAGVVYRISPPK